MALREKFLVTNYVHIYVLNHCQNKRKLDFKSQKWVIKISLKAKFDCTCDFFEEWNEITTRTNGVRTGALLGVISDIHRVCTNPEDFMDVRNDPQQGTSLQAVCSSNFLIWIWGMISFHSSKSTVPTLADEFFWERNKIDVLTPYFKIWNP